MTEEQIKKRLNKVCEEFLKILTKDIVNDVRKDMYVAGGCISSMLLNEAYSDYDIFFRTQETAERVRKYYCDLVTGMDALKGGPTSDEIFNGTTWFAGEEVKEYWPVVITENAITLQGKIQLITKFYGKPKDIVEKFDFKHLRAWYTLITDQLIIYDYVYRLLMNKQLVYTGSEFPVNSLSRVDKYIKKGWNCSPLIKVAILLDINRKIDLNDLRMVLRSAAGIDPNSRLAKQIEQLQDVTDVETLITKIEYL